MSTSLSFMEGICDSTYHRTDTNTNKATNGYSIGLLESKFSANFAQNRLKLVENKFCSKLKIG